VVVVIGVEERLSRPTKENKAGFQDYAHWVFQTDGYSNPSRKKKVIVDNYELKKAVVPIFEQIDDNLEEPKVPSHVHLSEPKITYVKSGQTITQIEITCKCGEVIRLDLDYN
jgi:hypothetical protein